MRILLIEDDECLRRLIPELLIRWDSIDGQQVIDAIDVVADLEAALERFENYDAIICDGEFPDKPGGRPLENWAIVSCRVTKLKRRIDFLVYSGNPDVCHMAAMCGLKALSKPAKTEFIYEALTAGAPARHWHPSTKYAEGAGVSGV